MFDDVLTCAIYLFVYGGRHSVWDYQKYQDMKHDTAGHCALLRQARHVLCERLAWTGVLDLYLQQQPMECWR